MECKQIYNTGLRAYLFDSYNIVDFTVLSLYLASYTLRFLVDRWIKTLQALCLYTDQESPQSQCLDDVEVPLDQDGGRVL